MDTDYFTSTRAQLAQLLSDERLRRSWSQTDLADKSGVGKARISTYETGRRNPTLDDVDRLFGALDLQLRLEVEPLWATFDASCDEMAAIALPERLERVRCAVTGIADWLTAAEPIIDGEVAAILQGVPLSARVLGLTVSEDRLDALATSMERYPPHRWNERTRDYIYEGRDPRQPGPMRWNSLYGEFSINVVPVRPASIGLLIDGREYAVRPLHDVEATDAATARLIRRVRERYSSSSSRLAAAATPSR